MRVIYKYTLKAGVTTLNMPQGAQVLTVQTQNENACLWALLDPSKPTEVRTFHMYGTGHRIDNLNLVYIGTFQLEHGVLVFHVFEQEKELG